VGEWVYALFLCFLVYVKGFRGDPTTPQNTYDLFSRSVNFNFSLVNIQKQQKHSNNKNH